MLGKRDDPVALKSCQHVRIEIASQPGPPIAKHIVALAASASASLGGQNRSAPLQPALIGGRMYLAYIETVAVMHVFAENHKPAMSSIAAPLNPRFPPVAVCVCV